MANPDISGPVMIVPTPSKASAAAEPPSERDSAPPDTQGAPWWARLGIWVVLHSKQIRELILSLMLLLVPVGLGFACYALYKLTAAWRTDVNQQHDVLVTRLQGVETGVLGLREEFHNESKETQALLQKLVEQGSAKGKGK